MDDTQVTAPRDPTASGPNPSGCTNCGDDGCQYHHGRREDPDRSYQAAMCDARAHLRRAQKAEAERDEARDWVRRMTAETRVLTCAFCGETYPPGTPETNHERLTAHVAVCKKHPMVAVVAERDEYAALLDESLAKWEALIATAGHICAHCKTPFPDDAMGEHMRTCEKSPMVTECARLTAQLADLTRDRDHYRDNAIIERRIADNLNADVKELKAALSQYRIDGDSPVDVRALEAHLAAATARAGEAETRLGWAISFDAGNGYEVLLAARLPLAPDDGEWAICDENDRGVQIDGRWRWPTADAAFAALRAGGGR